MRDEIFKIVYDPKTGFDECADNLTALMCYREICSIIQWVGPQWWDDDLERQLIDQLMKNYSEQTVGEAIEKYKNEQK